MTFCLYGFRVRPLLEVSLQVKPAPAVRNLPHEHKAAAPNVWRAIALFHIPDRHQFGGLAGAGQLPGNCRAPTSLD
jgi:hypothetical protein